MVYDNHEETLQHTLPELPNVGFPHVCETEKEHSGELRAASNSHVSDLQFHILQITVSRLSAWSVL